MGGCRCFLVNGAAPWAGTAAEGAADLLELGSYSSRLLLEWDMPHEFDADDVAQLLPTDPHVWTDGSLVLDKVSGASSSGSGFYAHLAGLA